MGKIGYKQLFILVCFKEKADAHALLFVLDFEGFLYVFKRINTYFGFA